MDNFHKLILVIGIVLLTSLSYKTAKADTYPVVVGWALGGFTNTSPESVCRSWWVANKPVASFGSITSVDMIFISPNWRCTVNTTTTNGQVYASPSNSCPNGGSISGSNCINAPVCISPQVRKTVSPYSCFTPVECVYPETDNGSGVCANNTCPAGQNRSVVTSVCQTPPVCGATETYENSSNTCKLYPLKCPGHTHANTASDQCLADAPLVCSAGYHDDGTYSCVADNAKSCPTNTTAGTINGIPQCIPKPNLDTAQQAAAAAQQSAVTAAAAAKTAALASQNAQTALAADPTNTVKQAAATNAAAASMAANSTYQDSNATASKASDDAALKFLNSIDQDLKTAATDKVAQDDITKADIAAAGGTMPTPDITPVTTWGGSLTYTPVAGSCPAPKSLVLHGQTIEMSYQPYCDYAAGIKPVVLALAFLSAGFIVVTGSKKE